MSTSYPKMIANRQIADGFVLHHQVKQTAEYRLCLPQGAGQRFSRHFVMNTSQNYAITHMLMSSCSLTLMTMSKTAEHEFDQEIPVQLKNRVFVIGSKNTPEALKRGLNRSFEAIGCSLAADCDSGTTALWDHEQLQHNEAERQHWLNH